MADRATQPQGRGTSMDDPLMILAILGALGITGWLVWAFGHAVIATVYAYWRYVQFAALHALGEWVRLPGIAQVHDWIGGLCAPEGALGLCRRDFSTVTWTEIADSTLWVNGVLLVALVVYCAAGVVRAGRVHPKLRFARAHTLESFIKEMRAATRADGALLYPHLRLFGVLDLGAKSLTDPVFRMSETSSQLLFRHHLVAGWREEGAGMMVPTIDRARAAEVFKRQLGALWTASEALSTSELLLVAIALPRVAATDPSLTDAEFHAAIARSDDMVRWCWNQFTPPAGREADQADPNGWLRPVIERTKAREIVQQYIGREAVKSILTRHAYVRTVIFALFTAARRLGVLPPAEMRWMRFYDPGLWYVLQSIGRQAPFPESAAVFCHYLYELRAREAILEPQVDKAVAALDLALSNYKFSAETARNHPPVSGQSAPDPSSPAGDEPQAVRGHSSQARLDPPPDPARSDEHEYPCKGCGAPDQGAMQPKECAQCARRGAVREARAVVAQNPVVIDTETTGMGAAQVIEVAILDLSGRVLLETLVRPAGPIPERAGRTHGISDEAVAQAPTWPEVHERVAQALAGRKVVAFNAEVHVPLLMQTAQRHGLQLQLPQARVTCLMMLDSAWTASQRDPRSMTGWRWRSLSAAAREHGYRPTGRARRAAEGCRMAVHVLRSMAERPSDV